jgi:hypothetical protein
LNDLFQRKPSKPHDILYKGKTPDELSRQELVECAQHLKDAHVKLLLTIAELNKKIDQLKCRP